MNEGRTNVVTFRVYKWTGMWVYSRTSKFSFVISYCSLCFLLYLSLSFVLMALF